MAGGPVGRLALLLPLLAHCPSPLLNRRLDRYNRLGLGTVNRSANGHNAPRYADFFNHEEAYLMNYKVQDYKGKHFLLKREYTKAIPHFERCLAIAADASEIAQAQYKLNYCRGRLGRNN